MPAKKKMTPSSTKTKKTAKRKVAVKKATAAPRPAKKKTTAGKPAAKKKVTKSAVPARRDGTGHLDPKYAAKLRRLSRESRDDGGDDRAFLRGARSTDDLAEELGEEAIATMTAGEDQSDRLNTEVSEEVGGPFVRTTGRKEYARGTDKSNPRSATREPFPKT
jgi:hypothetical protein